MEHNQPLIKLFIRLFTLTVLIFGIPVLITNLATINQIYSPSGVDNAPVAIVFGAGLLRDGSPTPVLRDRVLIAVNLYKTGKVQKLLLSGDNRFANYNEPAAMYKYAVSLGVPEQDIVLDYAGRRTYDTCFRARAIFGVNKAILVTQHYHMARALFTCNNLGLAASGVTSDPRSYNIISMTRWQVREVLASLTALVDVWLRYPLPVLGNPEPIYPIYTSPISGDLP
jgi:SanA protein